MRRAAALAARHLARSQLPAAPPRCSRCGAAAPSRALSSHAAASQQLLPPAAAAALPQAAPAAASAAESAADAAGWGPVDAAVAGLEAVHSATGLPWWASIALSTLCVRAALAPLALAQARAGAGVAAALAAARANGAATASPRALAAALAAHRASAAPRPPHPAWILAAPLAQLPVFVTALLAVRRLALAPASPLSAGGTAWAVDLTLPALDAATWTAPVGAAGAALPAAATLLMFANIQAAFGRAPLGAAAAGHYKLLLEWLLLPTLLAGLTLPHAVFAYWIPSNLWSLGQGAALRRLTAAQPGGGGGAAAAVAVAKAAPGGSSAAAQTPADVSGVAALIEAAAKARAEGRLPAAAAALAAARAAAPSDPRAAFAAGAVAAAARDWRRAADAYADAARLEADAPQRGRALFGLAVALSMQLPAPAPQPTGVKLDDGALALAQRAQDAFRAAAAARPGDAKPLLGLAAALRRAGRLRDAADVAADAVALDPAAAPLLAELQAAIAAAEGQGTAAVAHLDGGAKQAAGGTSGAGADGASAV